MRRVLIDDKLQLTLDRRKPVPDGGKQDPAHPAVFRCRGGPP
jgi:hypothetical protein